MARVKLLNVRIAFPQLFEPKQVANQGKAAFAASFLMVKGDDNFKRVVEVLKEVSIAQWGKKDSAEGIKVLKNLQAADKICLHNGNSKPDYEGFPGNYYVSARSYTRPKVLHNNKRHLSEEDGVIYPGCRVNAVLDIWAQDNKFGRRVNCGLGGVQFCGRDDAFSSSAPVSDDEFEDLAVEESSEGSTDESTDESFTF